MQQVFAYCQSLYHKSNNSPHAEGLYHQCSNSSEAMWGGSPDLQAGLRAGFLSTASSFLLLLATLLTTACHTDPLPPVKPGSIGWRPIATWSGHGNTQTESFNIESGQWRIKWKTTNESPPGAGTFKVMVHSAVSGRPLSLAVEHRGPGQDTAYVSEDPRLFHLVIESTNLDWSIAIEEGVAAVADGPDR